MSDAKHSPVWKSGQRYVIEGEWSGYRSSQQRCVHRQVTTRRDLVEWCAKTFSIVFTDGTNLVLTVRPTTPREKVKQIHGYSSLISDCAFENVTSVGALCAKQEQRKKAALALAEPAKEASE